MPVSPSTARSRRRRFLLAFLGLGVLLRLGRYGLQFPVWGDEAFICLNLLDRGFADLAGALRFDQVAPVLLLWAERAALCLLGVSELSLRLPSVLAGVASLFLFARLARLTLPPRAALTATAILAVSYYPVRHACEVKPYAFDLFFALALLLPAASWLRRPGRAAPLIVLALLVPVALAASYPSVFVAGGVSLALLPAVRRQSTTFRMIFILYNLILVACFAALFVFVARLQQESMIAGSGGYWDATFPPTNPLRLAGWLIEVHTGNLLAYPLGGRNGASAATLLLCLVGIVTLRRARRGSLLVLLLSPFVLTFIAALLRKYPYGGSARVAQHLVPSICLLAGLGATSMLRRHALALRIVWGTLFVIGLALLLRDVWKPFKTEGDEQARTVIAGLGRRVGPGGRLVVWDAPARLHPSVEWYLRLLGERVTWVKELEERPARVGRVWVLRFLTNESDEPTPPRASVRREIHPLSLGPEPDATCACVVWELAAE